MWTCTVEYIVFPARQSIQLVLVHVSQKLSPAEPIDRKILQFTKKKDVNVFHSGYIEVLMISVKTSKTLMVLEVFLLIKD